MAANVQAARPIVIVDIDGTIADVGHRLRYVTGVRKDWQRFFATMNADIPIAATIGLVRELAATHEIVVVTGRPSSHRKITEQWLRRHTVPYTRLLMRPLNDRRPDTVVKPELVETLDRRRIAFALDDREPVCAAYARLGITCRALPATAGAADVNAAYAFKTPE